MYACFSQVSTELSQNWRRKQDFWKCVCVGGRYSILGYVIIRPPTCPKILNCPKFYSFNFFVLNCPNFDRKVLICPNFLAINDYFIFFFYYCIFLLLFSWISFTLINFWYSLICWMLFSCRKLDLLDDLQQNFC